MQQKRWPYGFEDIPNHFLNFTDVSLLTEGRPLSKITTGACLWQFEELQRVESFLKDLDLSSVQLNVILIVRTGSALSVHDSHAFQRTPQPPLLSRAESVHSVNILLHIFINLRLARSTDTPSHTSEEHPQGKIKTRHQNTDWTKQTNFISSPLFDAFDG